MVVIYLQVYDFLEAKKQNKKNFFLNHQSFTCLYCARSTAYKSIVDKAVSK